MATSLTQATTRQAPGGRIPPDPSRHLLAAGQVILSSNTGLHYEIERLIGHGGFGQVYLARRLGRSSVVPARVCIKASVYIDGWLREAYFGQVLDGEERAIRVYDKFPLSRPNDTLYCLATEYASGGDLSAFLFRTRQGWRESAVRREIAAILPVLGKLHRGQLLHRDLTPLNIFVCDGVRLKLGDFGIVRHQGSERGVVARTLNPLMAPTDVFSGAAPKWQTRDDVYQVGQLLGMLVKGDARERVRPAEVRRLSCSDHLKEIIYRCIGERRKRYENADELIEALRNPRAQLRSGALASLKGAHIAFTGILKMRRDVAKKAARRAGAIIHSAPSAKTNVVVRGKPNPLQAAGKEGGRKLMEIKRLREKGHRITLLNEAQFRQLIGVRA